MLSITALALIMAACSTDFIPENQQMDNKPIAITATLAPKSPITKAIADKGDNSITASWAVDEHVAILYKVKGERAMADARVSAVDGSGKATIVFTVEAGTTDGTSCTLVYPLTAVKADKSGVNSFANLLSAQNGALDANMDVRVGEATINTTTPSLTVTTQPAPQFAIFKFTFAFNPLVLTINSGGAVVTAVSPTSPTGNLYVAVPPAASGTTYEFIAYSNTSKYVRSISSNKAIESGVFYQTPITTWDSTTALVDTDLSSITEDTVIGDDSRVHGSIDAMVKVSIESGATVVLDNVTLSGSNSNSYKWAGLTCEGDATLVLSGTNNVKGFFEEYPGIIVAKGKTLTIKGDGTLYASSNGWGAGIGAGYGMDADSKYCGTIVIEGGDITAVGGKYSAGIGGGSASKCDGIIIANSVKKVTATMGPGGVNAIGAGATGSADCGTITFGGVTMSEYPGYPEGSWIETPTSGRTYGGLTLTISTTTNTNDTWTLTPVM